jgi:two-component system OmpR family sensor kinase
MLFNSIRWRLQIWFGFLLLSLLIGFGIVVYRLERNHLIKDVDSQLDQRVSSIAFDLRRHDASHHVDNQHHDHKSEPAEPPPGSPPDGPYPDSHEPRTLKLEDDTIALLNNAVRDKFYYVVWGRDGSEISRSANAPIDLQLPKHSSPPDTHLRAVFHNQNREAYQFTELRDCVLVGRTTNQMRQALASFLIAISLVGIAILTIGIGIGWYITRQIIRPIADVSSAAKRIAAGKLSEKIPSPPPGNELAQMTDVLNDTFHRLRAAFDRQKQFTADAAHELRTPLTVLISETQTALARQRNITEYQEALQSCHDTAQQMRRLLQSLLDLARLDSPEQKTAAIIFDLARQVELATLQLRPLTQKTCIALHTDLQPAKVYGNPDWALQIATNLISNAIQYNRNHGDVWVKTRAETNHVTLTVTDTGCGISEEDLPHVFDRFYRADKSRSRATNNFGLGLAITKALADAAGAKIQITSKVNSGTTITVFFANESRNSTPSINS